MIRFGPWSTLLSLGIAFGLSVALALALRPVNRTANRLLAALLAVIALKAVPYAIGYAGFYDAHPWLSFAPFDLGLAVGPLLWLHVQALTAGRLPPRWAVHLAPAVLQLAYGLVCFAQPLAWKDDWDDRVHAPWIDPIENLLVIASLAHYLVRAWRCRRLYEAWLRDHVSNADEHRVDALRSLIVAIALWLLLLAGFEVAGRLLRFDYHDRFPQYAGLTLLLYAIGLEAWRQADRRHPAMQAAATDVPVLRPPPDWGELGRAWRTQTEAAGWWRDPDLDLARLARHLGTNTHYLSRAFNEGLGANFAQVIGEMRVAWVRAELMRADRSGDLLQVGLDAGFSSKTTFNRVFKTMTGLTPSAFRERARRPEA